MWLLVDMQRLSPPLTGILCPSKLPNETKFFGFGFKLQRKDGFKRKIKFVVSAELSKSFSLNLGLDFQVSLVLLFLELVGFYLFVYFLFSGFFVNFFFFFGLM